MIARVLGCALAVGPFGNLLLVLVGLLELVDRRSFQSGRAFEIACLVLLVFLAAQRNNLRLSSAAAAPIRWTRLIVAAAAVLWPFLPAVYEAFLVTAGDYPAHFFGVDSPYHLSQVFALLQHPAYPPESLNNVGVAFNYHFGTQLVAAALCRTFGFAPHAVYFGLLPGLFLISAACAVYQLLVKMDDAIPPAAFLFVLLGGFHYLAHPWDGGVYIRGVESFNAHFPHISTLSVMCLLVFLVYLSEVFPSSRTAFALTAALPAVVLLFKSPFVFHFTAFAGTWMVVRIRREGLALHHVAAALGAALLFVYVMGHVGNGNAVLRFAGLETPGPGDAAAWAKTLLFVLTPLALAVWGAERRDWWETLPYILATAGPLVLTASFRLEINGQVDPNMRQFTTLGPFFLYFGLLRMLHASRWNGRLKALALALYLSIGGLPAAGNRLYNLAVVVRDRSAGHEYVDNRLLAECLRHVPVSGALLVTNDLRYPANHFWRTMMQMQIPGIFGHRMYAGNLRWEKYFVDEERFQVQASLVDGTAEEVTRHAAALGWTHGILFKRRPFVRGDWPTVCENEEVRIVAFPSVSDRPCAPPTGAVDAGAGP